MPRNNGSYLHGTVKRFDLWKGVGFDNVYFIYNKQVCKLCILLHNVLCMSNYSDEKNKTNQFGSIHTHSIILHRNKYQSYFHHCSHTVKSIILIILYWLKSDLY